MTLKKINDGVMFYENFIKENLLWNITPKDTTRYEYSQNGVCLKHGEERLLMSILSPNTTKNYFLEVYFQHMSKIPFDIAGLTFLSVTEEAIECQSYQSSSDSEDRRIRVKLEDEMYTFFISKDGEKWNEIGNSRLPNSNRIGFFVDGVKTQDSVDLLVKTFTIYRDSKVCFKGVKTTDKINIFNDKGTLIEELKPIINTEGLSIDLSQIQYPFRGSIQILDSNGDVTKEYLNLEMYPGDIYEETNEVKFFVNGIEVASIDDVFYLGRMSGTANYIPFSIMNNSDTESIIKKEIYIGEYNPYSSGHSVIKLAFEEEELLNDELTYTDTLSIAKINPKETIRMIMKITRDKNMVMPNYGTEFMFRICLE